MNTLRKLRRLALALPAFAGVAMTATQVKAQGLGAAWNLAVADLQPGAGDIATLVVYIGAIALAIGGCMYLHRMGNRNGGITAGMAIMPLVAAFLLINIGHVIFLGSTDATGQAPTINGQTVTALTIQ